MNIDAGTSALDPSSTIDPPDAPPIASAINADRWGGRKLKMLWVNHHADFVGGCEAYIHNTATLLTQHGVESTLMYEVPGRVAKRFTAPFAGAFPMVDLENQLADLQPDIVYMHQMQDKASLATFTKSQIPVAKFFHDHRLFCLREHKYTTLGHQTCTKTTGMNCYTCMGFVERGGPIGVRLRTLGALEKEQDLNRQLDAFVVGSQYMREHVVAHGFDESQVHCVPLYAMPPRQQDYGPRNTSKLFFAGALVRGKGLDTLLHALADSDPRLELHIAGEGRQEQLFRDMAKELDIDQKVHFLGKLNSEQVQRELATCLCVVFPSRSPETFGLIGLEAMTHGTPVIATRVGGITEWLEDGVNGLLFESGNAEQLADALREMIGDIPRAIEMGESGLHKYIDRFKPEYHLSKLLGTMQSIVNTSIVNTSIVNTRGASNAISVG